MGNRRAKRHQNQEFGSNQFRVGEVGMTRFYHVTCVCILIAATTQVCSAQKRIKPLPKNATQREAAKFIKGDSAYNKTAAMNYYVKSLLASTMAPQVSDGLTLGNVKTQVMRELEAAYKQNPSTHASMINDLHTWCKSISNATPDTKKNYPYPAQYTSMLLIGSLNEKEATRTTLPVPYKKTYGTLFRGMSSTSDPVQVAALIGVLRHAKLHRAGSRMPAKAATTFAGAAVKIAESECPTTRTKSGHDWMQRRAIEILGELGWAGKDNAIAKMMDKSIHDKDASISKRCAAIEALGKLNIKSTDGLDVGHTAKGFSTTTAYVCREVSTRLLNRHKERGGAFEGGGGAYGGGGGYGLSIIHI